MLALQMLFFILLVIGGSQILDYVYNVPPSKTNAGLKLTVKKETIASRLSEKVLDPFVKNMAPLIRLSSEKEVKLKYNLARAGMLLSPKEYYAKAIVMFVLSLLFPALLLIVGVTALVPVGLIISGLILYKELTSYREELTRKREAIEMGLPGFIRAILYKINDSSAGVVKADLISIFEDYLKVANPVFAWDISVLIMEMKAKDIEIALRGFDNRLSIPEVGFLCNALIGLTRGEYQNETLAALAREMDIKSKENIKRELDKRPRKVMIASIPLAILCFIAIGYVLVCAMTGGIAKLV